jgi:GNAT superfamily N-acetyltransferase
LKPSSDLKWIRRSYQPGDETRLTEFLKEMDNEESDLQYWLWAHTKERGGLGAIVEFAESSEGRVIGYYAHIFEKMAINGEEVVGTQSFDLFVSPEFRRQGIFKQLLTAVMNKCSETRIPLSYGFTQKEGNAWKGFMRPDIGWTHIGNVPRMVCALNPGMLAKRRFGTLLSPFVSAGLRILKPQKIQPVRWAKRVPSFDAEAMSLFWNETKHFAPIMVARTPEYLKWRYLDRPNRQYVLFAVEEDKSIYGFMVMRVRRDEHIRCSLVDFLARGMGGTDDHAILRDLIASSIGYSSDIGADVVDVWIPHQYAKDFSSLGFLSRSTDTSRIVYSSSLTRQLYTDPQNYYLTMGDSYGG